MDKKILHMNYKDAVKSLAGQIKHLAICIPCHDKPHMLFSQDLAVMMYRLGVMRFPTLLIHQSGSAIHKTRNRLVQEAFKNAKECGVELGWLLLLDADMRFPGDLPLHLIRHNKDIIGCTYRRRTHPFEPMGITLEQKMRKVDEGLVEMKMLPTGALLIKADVFSKIKKPYFTFPWRDESEIGAGDEFEMGEDYAFCTKVREAGMQIWLDVNTSAQVGHVAEETLYPNDWKGPVEAAHG